MALPPDLFRRPTRAWLEARFPAPTQVQARGWPLLAAGRHALLVAPTGSGKTLAAFLTAIDRLGERTEGEAPGVRVLYVSPLKALVTDVERNLRVPLEGIGRAASELSAPFRPPRVAIRTGDTSARDRRLQSRDPAEILVTTPESLYLILGSKARETLATVETIIVDEIHALAGTKRGTHLALSLERVARRCRAGDPQRIGLSATARPTGEIARFLAGDRPVELVDASAPPAIELRVRYAMPAAAPSPPAIPDAATSGPAVPSIWSAIHPELLDCVRSHRSTLVFTNSRALCERLAQAINELAGEPLVRAHHGSVSHDERREIERALAAGELKGIVATSSLELGIDMAAVDQVVLVESPGAVARGLQRIGRAGHAVGETSRGVLYPKHRGDLLEAAVVARGMRAGEVEAISVPRGALDVLAQQIVAIAAEGDTTVDEIAALIGRTLGHGGLDRRLLEAVLDMLSGKYPSTDFAELRPRLVWDRRSGRISARDGAGRIALLSGGTIPDRGLYAVHLGEGGPRIGELDEEMVHETKPGDVVVLGASSWRVVEIGRDRVVVAPAPGEPGRLPFWRGDGPGRPIELGRALGRFVRELERDADPAARLRAEGQLDESAIAPLLEYLAAQRAATGVVPSDRAIVIERFRDELGDQRIAIHSPFGARVHAPWALAVAERWSAAGGGPIHPLWSDDGLLFRFADMDRPPSKAAFLPEADEVEALVRAGLEDSALFASQFRENAARALLLPRRHARARTPLWSQRLRAQNLHAVARGYPDFPILLETYRTCLRDVFDLPSLSALLRGVEDGEIDVRDVETSTPSPFARSLVFDYTARFLYQPDMPAAERRSQALALDRGLLRELLGESELRALLDPRAIDEVAHALQRLDVERQGDTADALHDRLRELGDLSSEALALRHAAPVDRLPVQLALLERAGRILSLEVAGEKRWIAVEDAALYRDGLGCALPPGLDATWLARATSPLEQLVLRHARTHGPFTAAQLATRLGPSAEALAPLLDSLADRGRLVAGEIDPRGREREWCDVEVLRRIKRRTRALLREALAPVSGEGYARFLLDWHGLLAPRPGRAALEAALDRLEGLPLAFDELERAILPARVADYQPGLLDQLALEGRIVWLGCGASGSNDSNGSTSANDSASANGGAGANGATAGERRIAIYRREHAWLHTERFASDDRDRSPLARALAAQLAERGASFFSDLVFAIPGASRGELEAALYELVWAGAVTNDSFGPLRAVRSRIGRSAVRRSSDAGRPLPRGRRPGRHAPPDATAGRWSLAAPLAARAPSATERLHRRTLGLLERHAIVSRESLEIESAPGGFAAIRPVLRELEEAGRVLQGRFVEGGTSAQFALPGVVDRLRAARERDSEGRAVLLAAIDPAQPWGGALAWPGTRGGRARRAVGTHVVLVDGRPALFLERGGRQLVFFDGLDDSQALAALRTLAASVSRLGVKRLDVTRIDGDPAHGSPRAPLFLRAGFRSGARGFEIDRLAPFG